ncbi:MAG: RsmB/NOP family class I SAM-dependent RNA methyltransferase [Alphaproteobacteria bacterium]|nr:RsmB/NOP family class I SAM-dependent RNA methyltransferase [Alphaproteobacteria bacterium]
MKPGARLQTAIELLREIDATGRPADQVLNEGFRKRRYAGSKDRAAIAESVYGVMRRRGELDWLSEQAGLIPDPRRRVLIRELAWNGVDRQALVEQIGAAAHGPAALSPEEAAAFDSLPEGAAAPEAARGNMPAWMQDRLRVTFGADWRAEIAALNKLAPVDLRVNTLKTDRPGAVAALAAEGLEAAPTPLSPIGLRLSARRPIAGTEAFKKGLVEIQDEGSQLASALVDARPGMKVVDFCAGGGGKSLALAAAMQNTGRIVACDTSESRLKRAADRLRRAGAHMVERRVLSSERDKWIGRRAGKFDGGFDRVLVDAPCSGTGTLRRSPDLKWRIDAADVTAYSERQAHILEAAARLVAPGGRMIYVTCSLFDEENGDPVRRFLDSRDDFFSHPLSDLWPGVLPGTAPDAALSGDALLMTPRRTGTDGFFIAIIGRKR